MNTIKIGTDGACSSNQFPDRRQSGYGFVVEVDGVILHEDSDVLDKGPEATNNTAEYDALIRALEWVETHYNSSTVNVDLYSDSQLMVEQVAGTYSVNVDKLAWRRDRVLELLEGLENWTLSQISAQDEPLVSRADELASESASSQA